MGEKYSQSIFMVVASVYARVTDKYDVLSAGCFQTIQKPQAVKSSINKSSWPVNPVVVPVSGPAPLVHSKPANTHELSKIWTLQITHSGLKLARRAITDRRTVPTFLNSNGSSVSFSLCHQRSQPDSASKWKKKRMPFIFPSGSGPHWRFPATFQLHYRDLCRDYDKNTCFLQFQSDQGHFSLYFFFALLSLIKAQQDRLIRLCSNSWHHLLPEQLWI